MADCLWRLKEATLLQVGGGWPQGAEAKISEVFGTRVVQPDFPKMKKYRADAIAINRLGRFLFR